MRKNKRRQEKPKCQGHWRLVIQTLVQTSVRLIVEYRLEIFDCLKDLFQFFQ